MYSICSNKRPGCLTKSFRVGTYLFQYFFARINPQNPDPLSSWVNIIIWLIFLWLIISKFKGWALIGMWALIETNTVLWKEVSHSVPQVYLQSCYCKVTLQYAVISTSKNVHGWPRRARCAGATLSLLQAKVTVCKPWWYTEMELPCMQWNIASVPPKLWKCTLQGQSWESCCVVMNNNIYEKTFIWQIVLETT